MPLHLLDKPSQNDFYEPRVLGRVFKRGNSVGLGGWIETNNAKKYSGYAELFDRKYFNFYNVNLSQLNFSHKYRFNSKFSIRHSMDINSANNGLGFTTILEDKSIFAIRKVKSIDNTLNLKYSFTNKMGLTFRARHYGSIVKNKEFYELNMDGTLKNRTDINQNLDRNVNYFNIDMVYTWQFATGSFMNVVWKNATVHSSDKAQVRYFDNIQNTLQAEQNNNLSLKLIYFLDYLTLKKILK
ncbi:hypothetical protein EGI22_10550 [Lacihabitans sp. LS3-19]|uniref:DUF5916 domain-containing protein n=1 Tax=Lacihabitans sp. LS3-19 TaxID=2487335 RepID=UPI0020CDD8AC|nr:DUF5916 domain-containing protein [Lacihabitans sp. LS3-19]MCP9768353.1 hypothetical protein [Lacihabitans sp. LS3-19]